MKKRFFFFALLAFTLSFNILNATSEIIQSSELEIVNEDMEAARAYLASYYSTTESDVVLTPHTSSNGYPAFRYAIVSQEITGTIRGSSAGFIVEEDLTGI